MNLSEIFMSMRSFLAGAWARAVFPPRTHWLPFLLIIALLVGGIGGVTRDYGASDSVECSDPLSCPDSDYNKIPDWLDPDIRNTTGHILSAGQIGASPGEATLLALIVGALVSLLYVSYAHSPLGFQREVEDVSRNHGSMDFRS